MELIDGAIKKLVKTHGHGLGICTGRSPTCLLLRVRAPIRNGKNIEYNICKYKP
jgi:hypothetical protein